MAMGALQRQDTGAAGDNGQHVPAPEQADLGPAALGHRYSDVQVYPAEPRGREVAPAAPMVVQRQDHAVALLPESWGFGPFSPTPLGGPPSPEPFAPAQRIVQRAAASAAPATDEALEERLRAAAGGASLDGGLRGRLEQGLGADLSQVRVHTDVEADRLARAVDAVAFTTGPDIFFRAGAFDPGSSDGLRLVAHEAVHTVQQAAGPVAGSPAPGEVAMSDPADRFEQAAEQAASGALAGTRGAVDAAGATSGQGVPRASGAPLAVQRLTAEERALDLKAPRYASNGRLQETYDNHPAMRIGEEGEAVALVQQGLLDDGFAMPISTQKTGAPDGIFGNETLATVKEFQTKYGLDVDGVVGRQTMGKLDELAGGGSAPPSKTPEIEATEEALGKHVVEGMDKANNDPHTPDSGIHYDYNYQANFPDRWKEEYRLGYADPAYFDHLGFMDWRLKPRVSASEGVKAWLKGLTIAECLTTVYAIEFDTLRAAVGDEKFDQRFGMADGVTPEADRLRISTGSGADRPQIADFLTSTDAAKAAAAGGGAGTVGDRPGVKEGEWYYFYNHPKYLLKHPGGAWQGENAIYMGRNDAGEQLWSGLGTVDLGSGATRITEQEMLREMIDDYNRPRDDNDLRALEEIRKANGGTLPEKYVEKKDGGTEFEDATDESKILNDPPYELDGTTRKGGFLPEAGSVLDLTKVKNMRGE